SVSVSLSRPCWATRRTPAANMRCSDSSRRSSCVRRVWLSVMAAPHQVLSGHLWLKHDLTKTLSRLEHSVCVGSLVKRQHLRNEGLELSARRPRKNLGCHRNHFVPGDRIKAEQRIGRRF